MNYVYAASGTIILIFIFLILKKKKKSRADYLLIGVNLMISLFMLADVLVRWKLTSGTVIFQNAVPLFIFPLFILYVLQFIRDNQKIGKLWLLIWVPAAIFLVLSIIDHYVLANYQTPEAVLVHFNTPSIWYQLIFKGSQIMYISILIWVLYQLRDFELKLKQGYSTIETIDVKWLKHFTWIYLGSIVVTFVLFLTQNVGLLPFEINQVFGIVYGILTLSVFYMNYQGIQHYTLSQVHPEENKLQIPDSDEVADKEKVVALTANEIQIEKEMLQVIRDQQLYLEPKFSLDDLSKALGKGKHQISKIINAKVGRSFYDLINGFRVEHLKKMMDDPKNRHFTILAMGLESGFNSKASLNRIFKNTTGLTPKQYQDQKAQSVG